MSYGHVPVVGKRIARVVQGKVMQSSAEQERGFVPLDEVYELGDNAFDTAHQCGGGATRGPETSFGEKGRLLWRGDPDNRGSGEVTLGCVQAVESGETADVVASADGAVPKRDEPAPARDRERS